MSVVNNRALVLEGGGMRGIFTAGVLDYFLDNDIEFPYVVGVSAGCTNAFSYLSKQRGRSLYAYTTLMDDYHYMGLKTLLTRGEFIDMNVLYKEFLYKIYPFDFEEFIKGKSIFESVATDALTAQPHYLGKSENIEELKQTCKASSSMPFINKVVDVNGIPMVDGGVSDSIPIERAISLGYKDTLVVTTQCKGFSKKVGRFKIPRWVYPKYPKVVDALNNRATHYNNQIEMVERLEREGAVSVIRPMKPLVVGRLTTDTSLLRELYQQGYSLAKEWSDSHL